MVEFGRGSGGVLAQREGSCDSDWANPSSMMRFMPGPSKRLWMDEISVTTQGPGPRVQEKSTFVMR